MSLRVFSLAVWCGRKAYFCLFPLIRFVAITPPLAPRSLQPNTSPSEQQCWRPQETCVSSGRAPFSWRGPSRDLLHHHAQLHLPVGEDCISDAAQAPACTISSNRRPFKIQKSWPNICAFLSDAYNFYKATERWLLSKVTWRVMKAIM